MAIGIDDAIVAVGNTLNNVIDKIWPNPTDEAAAQVAVLKATSDAAVAQLVAANQAAVAEASSADPWTSRARPSFMYVMYILILFSIPMGILSAFNPVAAQAIATGMGLWLKAIPTEMWSVLFGCFAVYSGGRTIEKVKGVSK